VTGVQAVTRWQLWISHPPYNWRAIADFVQDEFDQFELRLPVDVLKIEMAGPGGLDMVIFGQIYRFADPLDRFDKGPGFFGKRCLCSVQILNAVPVDLGRADARCQGKVALDGPFFVKRDIHFVCLETHDEDRVYADLCLGQLQQVTPVIIFTVATLRREVRAFFFTPATKSPR
jgi:hypothetical protein